ncbi:MAG: BREX-1 system phosphatase PglZ type B [Chloroflexota bacterium]
MAEGRRGVSLLDALVTALLAAAAYNRNDQEPPVAVLWTDKEREWEPLLPTLRSRLPPLTLGAYDPSTRTGPAYWLRCVLARTLPQGMLAGDDVPIVYLPGVGKAEIRAVEDCPVALQPLAELQYRGTLWTQRNGRDWTVAAFLQTADGGLGISVAGDAATRDALRRALLLVAEEPLSRLEHEAPLRAAYFDGLLNPDPPRSLLLWLDNPSTFRERSGQERWAAFRDLCRGGYGFQPEKDGPVSAAELLGGRAGGWKAVWERFAEVPSAYPNLPALLRQARPAQTSLFDRSESWPQDNEEAEGALRDTLLRLANQAPPQIREQLATLEREHGARRDWVWAQLGQAPLAHALQHLTALGESTARSLGGATLGDMAAAYVEWGWRADAAVIDALAHLETPADATAVQAAVTALYVPWLEAAARAWQQAVGATGGGAYVAGRGEAAAGTCLLFSDGLRFDLGRRLAGLLEARGLRCAVTWRLAALPTVTATAKRAALPVADRMGPGSGLDPSVRQTGTRVTADVLRRLLTDDGVQVLQGDETGNPDGRAWTEQGDIDSFAHEHGWKVARFVVGELRALADRVETLLAAGWPRVQVVTDHGWLLAPGGLPKADLPEHLTELRKGRCARLKAGSQTEQQVVPWFWDPSVRIAVAPGIACFEAGRECEHGGLSPQECVVPVLTITSSGTARAPVQIESVVWRGLVCRLRLAGAAGLHVDLRTRAADPATSITTAPKLVSADGTVSLPVPDDDRLGDAAFVVVLAADGSTAAQSLTTVGG